MDKIFNIDNVYKEDDEICLEISGSDLWSEDKKIIFLKNVFNIKEIKTYNIGGDLNNVKG